MQDIATDDSDKAIVRTIIDMAQSLNQSGIAEGVGRQKNNDNNSSWAEIALPIKGICLAGRYQLRSLKSC